jgi:hypothetical protein
MLRAGLLSFQALMDKTPSMGSHRANIVCVCDFVLLNNVTSGQATSGTLALPHFLPPLQELHHVPPPHSRHPFLLLHWIL